MEIIFYFTCFFSFIKWFGIGNYSSDIQPYCMIFAILIIARLSIKEKLLINIKLWNLYMWICVAMGVATIFTIIDGTFSGVLRYIATYVSLIAISYCSYYFCKRNNGIKEKYIKIIINAYLVVGIIQYFVNRTFLYSFVSNARTTSNRGVISLASEPSFYGYVCIFLLILVLDFKENKKFYSINLLIQILFLAKSSVTFLYLVIFFAVWGIYILKNVNKKYLFIFLGAFIGLAGVCYYFFNSESNSSQRIVYMLKAVMNRDFKLLLNDTSISIRLGDIRLCLEGFIDRLGIPKGFATKKISSGFGSILYTMGWFGIIVILKIFTIIKGAFSDYRKVVMPIFLTIIMFSAIQVSSPIFAFLIGYFVFLGTKKDLFLKNNPNTI